MSSYNSYKKSLIKYIHKRSCLKTIFSQNFDTKLLDYVTKIIETDDLIIPTIFLTIVNSQNKKYNISMQSYYTASAIIFYCVLVKVVNNRGKIISTNNETFYYNLIINLTLCSTYSINQNMKTIKTTNHKNLLDIYINLMHEHCTHLNQSTLLLPIELQPQIYTNNVIPKNVIIIKKNLITWYGKQDKMVATCVEKFIPATTESYSEYINKGYGALCELTFVMGWIQGCGKISDTETIKTVAKKFSLMYKISNDYAKLVGDIYGNEIVSKNYIINHGIQQSYNHYMENKQKFIEKCMTLDIYTNTMKEIVITIDDKINNFINELSPDIMSTMSSTI